MLKKQDKIFMSIVASVYASSLVQSFVQAPIPIYLLLSIVSVGLAVAYASYT